MTLHKHDVYAKPGHFASRDMSIDIELGYDVHEKCKSHRRAGYTK